MRARLTHVKHAATLVICLAVIGGGMFLGASIHPEGMVIGGVAAVVPLGMSLFLPAAIIYMRGYRADALRHELTILGTHFEALALALGSRKNLDYRLACVEYPEWEDSRTLIADPAYQKYFGPAAHRVFRLAAMHPDSKGKTIETIDRIMSLGITDFKTLVAYAETGSLEAAMLSLGHDIPIEYARAAV